MIFLLVAALSLGDQGALTNDDIIRLTRSGLPAPVILAKIETSETAFDASVDGLIALAEAGVNPEVIRVMTMAAAGRPADRPEIGEPEVHEDVALEGLELPQGGNCGGGIALLLLEDGALSRMDRHEVGGPTRVGTLIPGVRSEVRTTQRRPSFVFCVPDEALDDTSVYGESGFSLISLRTEVSTRVGVEATSDWARSRTEVAPGVFRVEADEELTPGEYAILIYLGDAVWTFGITE